jgi:hypothetical protein
MPGQCALIEAVFICDDFEVSRLLDAGADINQKSTYGSSVLYIAVQSRCQRIVQNLLQRGADHSVPWRRPLCNNRSILPIHEAVYLDEVEIVDLLLRFGADINPRDLLLRTPLYIAVYKNYTHIVDLLLQRGADHSLRGDKSRLPIHEAVYLHGVEILVLLLRFGADINARDRSLRTPLHLAIYWNKAETVDLLLRHGADMDARTCFKTDDNNPPCQDLTSLEIVTFLEKQEPSTNRDEVRGLLEAEYARRGIAFLMGQHPRLGKNSPAYSLDPEIARMVMKFL